MAINYFDNSGLGRTLKKVGNFAKSELDFGKKVATGIYDASKDILKREGNFILGDNTFQTQNKSQINQNNNIIKPPITTNIDSKYVGMDTSQINAINKNQNNKIPDGWDIETYNNFKKANPTLEPNIEDTKKMLSENQNNNISQNKYTSSSGDLAIKNNNPGNLKDPITGKFQQFSTPQEGQQAQINQLELYKTGQSSTGINGDSSLAKMISVYAPASDKNNPDEYANYVAEKLGVSKDTPLSQINTKELAKWMTSIESPQMFKTLYGENKQDENQSNITSINNKNYTPQENEVVNKLIAENPKIANDDNLDFYVKKITESNQKINDAYDLMNNSLSDIQNGIGYTPEQNQQLQQIQNEMEQARNIQQIANASAISHTNSVIGTALGIGTGQTNIIGNIATIQNVINSGLMSLSNLNNQYYNTYQKLQNDFKDGNIKSVQASFKELQDLEKQRTDNLDKIYTTTQKANNDARDFNFKIQQEKFNQEAKLQEIEIKQQQLNAGDTLASSLSKDAINMLAQNYAITGQMPSFGMGKSAAQLKTEILNKAATIGSAPQIIEAQQTYKNNQQALNRLTISKTKLEAINNTITSTLPMLGELADKINMPLLPSPMERAYINSMAAAGNSDASNYLAALNTIQAQLSGSDAAEVGSTQGGQMYIERAMEAIKGGLSGQQYRDLQGTFAHIIKTSEDSIQNEINSVRQKQFAILPQDEESLVLSFGINQDKQEENYQNNNIFFKKINK